MQNTGRLIDGKQKTVAKKFGVGKMLKFNVKAIDNVTVLIQENICELLAKKWSNVVSAYNWMKKCLFED